MNPFGAYALGMSSTADPDVAAQVGASMYNNALQNQQQYDIKMQEMLMKQQDEQLKNQALANYLVTQGGMTPEEANAKAIMLARLPGGFQNAALQNETGIMTPAQQESIDIRRTQQQMLDDERKRRAEEAKKQKLNTDVEQLGKTLSDRGIPELSSSMLSIEKTLKGYDGQDIPGYGEIAGQLPEFMISDKGKDMRQEVSDMANQVLKARSGLALTEAETARLFKALGVTKNTDDDTFTVNVRSDDQLRKGIELVGRELAAKMKNVKSTYDPEAIAEYTRRGNSAFEYLDKGRGGNSFKREELEAEARRRGLIK